MKKQYLLVILRVFSYMYISAESIIPLPSSLPQGHPRLLITDDYKPILQKQITDESWANEVLTGINNRIDKHVNRHQSNPEWMVSRLMMYWKSKATQVYINGGMYAGADGEAPVPTPRFGSTRGVSSPIKRPKLEDIIPYMDDTKGVFFHNTAKEGNPLEWVDQASVSGMNIESVNREIIGLGRDAAFVYWLTGDQKYAQFAYDIFNTYMTGMYYRKEPIDKGNGHAQTLVGMSTFEVIQETVLSDLSVYYDFLHSYIEKNHTDKIIIFEAAFKNWIDITIKNGVPHNNWNLHQANIILSVAMVLDNNHNYSDGKGREYYIHQVLNVTVPRQWSVSRLMEYGYDFSNGIWNECPGYAQSVTREFMHFIQQFDNSFNMNMLPHLPVMYKAVDVLPQYLFPNGQISAFGDTYYSELNTSAITDMIRLAQKYGDKVNEQKYTEMYRSFDKNAGKLVQSNKPAPQVSSFFAHKPLDLDDKYTAGNANDYLTQTFYAPNVSWFVQRSGRDKENALMISQVGSYGNHAHANGISIELYGKGYVLGAESGIGSSYFEKPYLEYYSQFPAHNTVMVDGISKYPEMLSNHPFVLLSCYPASGRKSGYFPDITFSEVYFVEPESRSDQQRLLSIIRTGETTGYYVDIFRSKRQRSGDKFHDYFYHNLGQDLNVTYADGAPIELHPNDEMGFAGGHLFALDYMWDKKSARTEKDYKAIWEMAMPDGNNIYMNLWMKGYPGREVFKIKSPSCKAFRGNHGIPYAVEKEPYLTIAARQHGAAWDKPFVSVFEPTTSSSGSSISNIQYFNVPDVSDDFVGVIVVSENGRKDFIFSSVKEEKVAYNKMSVQATYAVVSENENDFTLFMGSGKHIMAKGFNIEAVENTTVVLEYKNGAYYLTTDAPIVVKPIKGRKVKFGPMEYQKVEF